MGIMDKAKEFANNEENTDKVLDKGAEFAKDKLGQDKADKVDKVDKARDALDDKLGDNQGNDQQQ